MTNRETIGGLIEDEVRKQQIPTTEFAKMIYYQRDNVHDIFKHGKMDIAQLKQTSKVLSHNFSRESTRDVELMNDSKKSKEEVMRQEAISQFLNVVLDVPCRLRRSSAIVFSKLDKPGYEGYPAPDSGLFDYFTIFTIGEALEKRIGSCVALPVAPTLSDDNCMIEVHTNVAYRSACVGMKLGYKAANERYKFSAFAFEIYTRFGRK